MSQEISVDAVKVTKIVEMREAGYTWFQVDQMVFPEVSVAQARKKSPSWHLAKKHNAPAFTKRVHGGWGPTQVVEVIRKFNPFAAKPETKELTYDELLQNVHAGYTN